MDDTVSFVAILMWAGALALIGFAVRRKDDSVKHGLRIGGGYFVIMAPRMFFALFMAGFAAALLPGRPERPGERPWCRAPGWPRWPDQPSHPPTWSRSCPRR